MKQLETGIKPKDKILMFFFGVVFVSTLGRHYFANLDGSAEDKSQLLKWYYLGLAFWFGLLGILAYLKWGAL